MHRVVLVAYYYPPMGGAAANRVLGFARHLPAHGWAATVVAPTDGTFGHDDSLPLDLPAPGRVIRCLSPEPATLLKRARGGGSGGIVVEATLGKGGSRLRRWAREWLYVPDAQAPFIPFAALAAIRASRGADAILSSGPPVSAHVAACLAARVTGLPWIADVRDLWTPRTSSPDTARARLDRRILDGLLRRASHVVTVSGAFVDLLSSRLGRSTSDFTVLPNGFDPEDYAAPRVPPERFTLTFTGMTHGPRQDLTVFLETLAGLLAEGRIERDRFRLRIVGVLDGTSRALVARCGLRDILEDDGFRPHAASAEAQRNASALLLLLWSARDEIRSGVRPAKLPEYLGAGRPILALGDPDCEAAGVLSDCGAGTTVRFDDAEGIAAALTDLHERWGREGDVASPAARSAGDEHSRSHLAGRLAGALDAARAAPCRLGGP